MRSLKLKLVFFCTIIVFIVNAIFTVANYYFQKKEQLAKLDKNIVEIVDGASKNLIIPLFNIDNESIDKTLKAALSYQALVAISVRSDNAETVVSGKARNKQGYIVDFTLELHIFISLIC